jgi:hypothetical protein
MVDTMSVGDPRERFLREPASGSETPTGAAELNISMVPAGIRLAGPPVAGPAGPGPGDRLKRVGGLGRFRKDRGQVSAAGLRIQAAIEAEATAVLEASAETIEAELAWITSHRPGPEERAFRRWSRPVPGNQVWISPNDTELTAAADLRIRLVPS